MGLTILAGVIVGVVPGLQATGRAVQGSLQQLSSRGSTMRLGRAWTALIIVQVAVAVAVLPYALWGGGRFARAAAARPDYPVNEFVQASLSLESDGLAAGVDSAADEAARATRFAASVEQLRLQLEAEPSVAAIGLSSSHPGSEFVDRMQIEGEADHIWAWRNDVDIGLFEAFEIPILAGRGFVASDATSGSNAVIVDRTFAEEVLGGGNVIGRRVRDSELDGSGSESGPWLEIVGIVPAFTPPHPFQDEAPKIFKPLNLADTEGSVRLAVRMKHDQAPAAFLAELRIIGADVDPALRIAELRTAAEAERLLRKGFLSLGIAIVAITGSVLLLSAAGIYAMMSFTVASRRREIGIRAALGAAPRRVLAGIFKRAGAQLGAGVLVGLGLAEAVPRLDGGSFFAGEGMLTLVPVAAIVLAIGLLAALGPARRGLAIQPTEALRDE